MGGWVGGRGCVSCGLVVGGVDMLKWWVGGCIRDGGENKVYLYESG